MALKLVLESAPALGFICTFLDSTLGHKYHFLREVHPFEGQDRDVQEQGIENGF